MKPSRLSRRKFLSLTAAGAGTLILGQKVSGGASDPRAAGIDPLKIVSLGKSGIKSTLLGMGTGYSGYNRTSNITRTGVAESVIRSAYEKGIRFFDCADAYGTHPHTRDALKSYPRESYVINTKMWIQRGGIPEPERPEAAVVVDRFRKELNTDYIDIVQLHLMMTSTWTDEQKKYMDDLETLKAKKIIRAHGVTVHSLAALKASVESPWVDVIHVRINAFGQEMDSKDPAEVVPVLQKLHEAGKGVVGMKLIGNGRFRDDSAKIDETIKFTLGLGTVDLIIIGFERPEQIDNYMERIRSINL